MRCLALAQAWDGPVRFVSLDPPAWVRERLAREGFALTDRENFRGADWIVVDGYHFTADYLRALPARTIYLDDLAAWPEYPVDVVWNPGVCAPDTYGETPALLGPDYYPLRHEFHRVVPRPVPERARRVLVTLGGADPEGYTSTAIQAARGLDCELRVVVGGSNPIRPELAPGELLVGVENMAPVLAWAELAVAAAGVTAYELAFLGIPTVLVTVADNQEPNATGFAAAGAALNLGRTPPAQALHGALQALVTDRARREGLAQAGRRLVDGQGPRRVTEFLRTKA